MAAGLVLLIGVPSATLTQQAGTPTAPKPLVPLAASSLAADPEAHYGEYVTLMGAVEQRFSRSVFSVDQDPARAGKDVLIVAPTLTGEVVPNAYVTVIGDVVRFDPAEIARRLTDYRLDLAPDAVEQYRGRPAILATAVINASMVDLAKRVPPAMTAEEEAYREIMKRVGPAFTALRGAIGGSDANVIKENTSILKKAFSETETFWKARGKPDATAWAHDARTEADSIEQAAALSDWDTVKASTTTLGQACQNCHAAHRERLDDGSFRIKQER